MPFFKGFKKLKKSITSRVDAHLSSAAQPSVSLPKASAPNILQAPSGRPASSRLEINIPVSARDSSAIPREQATSDRLSTGVLTPSLAADEVTSRSQQANLSHLAPTKSQPAIRHNPVAATSPVAAPPEQGGGTSSWQGLEAFLRALNQSAGVFGPLKVVVNDLVRCTEIYERVAGGRDDFEALHTELEDLFEGLTKHFSRDTRPTITTSMESLCKSIQRELNYVRGKKDRGIIRRYLEAGEDADGVLGCYRRIQEHLQRLSLNANLTMWEIVDNQAADARLDRLCQSLSACYNSAQATELKRGACTPGTRIEVLGEMYGWVRSRGAGSVYWLNGMAGTGKTTIAYSLCIELDAAHNLGASFFCSRLLPECRDVNQIVPSIAYQLADFSRPFRWALSRVLEKERNVHTQLLHIQFEKLIVKPLVEVRDTLPEDLVVVIDALDECDNKGSTSQILEALLTKTKELPIKFFLASRPEPEIRDQMRKQGGRQAISRLVLHELDKGTVQGDIETYLRAALEPIKPLEADITALVQQAGILFIYAATVARYIGYDNFGRNPRSRLQTILSISSSDPDTNHTYEIDELYTVILEAAFGDPRLSGEERGDMKQVLYTALCAREPLTIRALSGLLGLRDIERVHAALRPLWSVLHVVESSELVTTLHASFPDYMFDPKRSKGYCCDPAVQDHTLAQYCFERIKGAKHQFNICGLESSYIPDKRVENLSARVENAIPPELPYACRYWAAHLDCAKKPLDLIEQLEDFLSTRLLLWMEIMNLKNCIDAGIGVMRQAEEWCLRQTCPEDLKQLARDAWRFVAAFTLSPVSQSTPHIYVSMLLFWPESNPIAKHYAKRAKVPIVAQGSAIARRQLAFLTMWSIDERVSKVAWSPDGTRIALVAGGQIFLLDAVTGRIVIGPLQQIGGAVQSIGFSPDSTRVVSGSEDGTMDVWDAQNGKHTLGPLQGHTNSVNSVAYSFDGTRVASGSEDNAIYVRDARSGQVVLGPLKGHTYSVTSVAFSPDGSRIVSGSDDTTIRIWDTLSGRTVHGPLKGHTDSVTSVAFSPNGTRIASGSYDNTIRMWDAQSGRPMHQPFKGHTDWVTSVAFSPDHDGSRIVSGGRDRTVCMWDARSGRMMHDRPLKGHTGSVTSVAFSPDGTRIVSGSHDRTIHIWDARSGRTMPLPPEGHTDLVKSVAFSPDGSRIVSGSRDNTLLVWDARSGEKLVGPLKGHTKMIASVAFSPNSTRFVSGSHDRTLSIWDTQSGRRVHGPLTRHNGAITSVSFSPNGTRIASGSEDHTICIWDAHSGQLVLEPLQGHTEIVTSVAFSHNLNGARIISSSDDHTLRIWDSRSGKMVLGPLQVDTDSVTSVAFSRDDTRIVAGSNDGAIYIWDAQSRKAQRIISSLLGHAGSVKSVAFSHDGSRIVSGSDDTTIRVWDTHSGKMISDPLRGHADSVNSVAFSPDDTHIVSGSDDGTVRMWDIKSMSVQTPSSNHILLEPTLRNINSEGWVLDRRNESNLLLWIPSDLRPVLLPPRNIFSISTDGYVRLDCDDFGVGQSWTERYQPA